MLSTLSHREWLLVALLVCAIGVVAHDVKAMSDALGAGLRSAS